jgi:hypothetical protein
VKVCAFEGVKERTCDERAAACDGTAFASCLAMRERRDGASDRRASRRGGRRHSDHIRHETDALRTKWEALERTEGASALDGPLSDDDEIVTEPPHLGYVRRLPFPPRK